MRAGDMAFSIIDTILARAFALVFLISPFLADVKITRPKLMFFELALAVLFLSKIIFSVIRGEFEIKKHPSLIPVFFYFVASCAFWYFSPNRALSWNELRRILFFAISFFLGSQMVATDPRDGKNRIFFLWCFAVGTLWAAIYGILQHSGGIWIISVPKMERVISTFGNPIFFGVYLTISIPILAVVLSGGKEYNLPLKILSSSALILGLVAMYYTATRASWLALGFIVLVYILFLSKFRSWQKLIFLVLVIIAGGFFLYKTRSVWTRQQAHLLIWRDTMRMWVERPVFGVGAGLFHINFPDYASDELRAIWPQDRAIVNDAHNEFVQTLAETGIVGISVFLWVFVTFFASAYRFISDEWAHHPLISSGDKKFATAVFLAALGGLFQNFFSVDMRFAVSGIYIFALMGMAFPIEDAWKFNFKNLYLRTFALLLLIFAGYILIRETVRPYAAVKHEASRADFFDEKILDAAKTISDLEALALKHPTEAAVFEKLGWVYAKEKNFNEAIKNYRTAIRLKPDLPGPYNNIGNILFLANRLDEAIGYYEKSISVKPDQIDSRINLALAYYYRGRLGPAAEQIKEVLRLDPANEKAALLMKKMKE